MQARATQALFVLLVIFLFVLSACGGGSSNSTPNGGISNPTPNPGSANPTPTGGTSGGNNNGGSSNGGTNGGTSGGSNSGGTTNPGQINHILIMFQENRSFDMYFGLLNDYRAAQGLPRNVDGLPTNASNPSANGTGVVKAFHLQTMCTEDLSPFWNESHIAFNRSDPTSNTPTLDGFVTAAANFSRSEGQVDTAGLRAMGYYDASDIPYYYFMATQFAISDRWFAPVDTNTSENRHYMYAATSSGRVYPWTVAPDTHQTIFDLLQAKGISWRVYADKKSNSTFFEFQSLQGMSDHIVPMSQLFSDLSAGTLPSVVMIETDQENEHPDNNVQTGAAFAAQVINALIASPNWKDSALFLSYDESGGLYDHVAPMTTVAPDSFATPIDLKPGDVCYSGCTGSAAGFTRTGFRVPFTVISPYAKPHYVSHTPADHTAMLKFIEDRFGLQRLSNRDAAQPDLGEFFDYSAPNLNPPAPPSQPTNGPCYHDRLP